MGIVVGSRVVDQHRRNRAVRPTEARCESGLQTTTLPPWAVEALCMAGMTVDEIRALDGAARTANTDEVEDESVAAREDELLRDGAETLLGLVALAEGAARRLRRGTDRAVLPFAHRDDRRALALVERLLTDLERLRGRPLRQVG